MVSSTKVRHHFVAGLHLFNNMQLPSKEDLGVTDDFVEYRLFTAETLEQPSDSGIFQDLLQKYNDFLKIYTDGYIWQRDVFHLALWRPDRSILTNQAKAEQSWPSHLYGQVRFGDNIEDEWYIVFMLLELTSNFPELVVRYVLGCAWV